MDTRSQQTIRNDIAADTVRYEIPDPEDDPAYSFYKTFPSSGSYTLTFNAITYYDDLNAIIYGVYGSYTRDFHAEYGVSPGGPVKWSYYYQR